MIAPISVGLRIIIKTMIASGDQATRRSVREGKRKTSWIKSSIWKRGRGEEKKIDVKTTLTLDCIYII